MGHGSGDGGSGGPLRWPGREAALRTPIGGHRPEPPPATAARLGAFLTGLRERVPLRALWAHGSLAGGDHQEGRGDPDLVAVLDRPAAAEEERGLTELHRRLAATGGPPARALHCGYPDATAPDDPEHPHLAWAHGELTHRPLTPSPAANPTPSAWSCTATAPPRSCPR